MNGKANVDERKLLYGFEASGDAARRSGIDADSGYRYFEFMWTRTVLPFKK